MSKSNLQPDEHLDEAAAILDDVLSQLADVLDEDEIAASRDLILDAFAAHPVARLLAERVSERQPRVRSGENAQPYLSGDDAAESDATATRKKAKVEGGER
jgi:hypothetical protein